jgi:putative sigma-54 modulation protein
MQISVTFRHLDPSPALKSYAQDKLMKMKKYLNPPIEAHVVLTLEKFRHYAEVTIAANGLRINSEEVTDDMYSAIDKVIDKIERQVKKHKEKIKNHGNAGIDTVAATSEDDEEESEEPAIRGSAAGNASAAERKAMSVAEAVKEMQKKEDDFLVFTNTDSQSVNVVYKRKNGDYGLIEPEK